jgi:hypothetical protein
MRLIITLFLLFASSSGLANTNVIESCQHLEETTEAKFILFSKRDLVELGECIGISFLKNKVKVNLVESCNEIDEDKRNILGILSLSKREAIQIGQCAGVINFIYQHYHGEKAYDTLRNRYSNRKYSCKKGDLAITLIRQAVTTKLNRESIKDLLCEA